MPPGRIGAQRVLERLLAPERLDGHVDAATVGQSLDRRNRIAVLRVERDVGAQAGAPCPAARRLESMPMISDAPLSFAPSVAHRPIGPCANTATASPTLMLPLSAPDRPVEKMSEHSTTSSSVRSAGIGARLARASGTSRYSAQAPLIVLPKRQPPSAAAALRVDAVQAVEALAARRDRADDDALADRVELVEPWAELVDDADRLVTQDQARLDRILAADDVHVRAADRRGRDADDRLAGARRRLRDLFDRNPILALEHHRFHRVHETIPLDVLLNVTDTGNPLYQRGNRGEAPRIGGLPLVLGGRWDFVGILSQGARG